jgi:hypothetical protein
MIYSGAVILALSGCIIIPTDYYAVGVRRNVGEKTTAKLETGKTTKRDAFLLLGEPDYASQDGQRIGYAWTKVKALIIVASYGGGGSAEVQRSYILEISFANDLVRSTRVIKDWGSQVPAIREVETESQDAQ